jgi:hypothetical protein
MTSARFLRIDLQGSRVTSLKAKIFPTTNDKKTLDIA